MEEIVKLVAGKLGISEDIARQAVQLVLGQLKQHFPAPIAGQIDALMTGKAGLTDMANLDLGNLSKGNDLVDKGEDLLGKLGGLFSKK